MVATVQSGGRIEIVRPDLPVGSQVEVNVSPLPGSQTRWKLSDILAGVEGHNCFNSAAEADAHLRALRDEWD